MAKKGSTHKPRLNGLTVKQRKWIKEYIETGNATEAAMRVYDCKNRDVAESIGSENLGKLAFDDLMDRMGLTDITLLNVGAAGILAEKTDITGDKHPDYNVRHKYWETLLKLKKRLGNDTSAVEFKKGDESIRIVVTRSGD